jgi:hypothetical protein
VPGFLLTVVVANILTLTIRATGNKMGGVNELVKLREQF